MYMCMWCDVCVYERRKRKVKESWIIGKERRDGTFCDKWKVLNCTVEETLERFLEVMSLTQSTLRNQVTSTILVSGI